MQAELKPLGVKVLTVVTGGVRTDFMAHTPEFKLPDGSLFKPAEKSIDDRYHGVGFEKFPKTEVADYARQVVNDVLKGASGQVWRGAYAGIMKWVSGLLSESTKTSLYLGGLDLSSLKPHPVA
jgi:1-acylglycerone phosphate reductase